MNRQRVAVAIIRIDYNCTMSGKHNQMLMMSSAGPKTINITSSFTVFNFPSLCRWLRRKKEYSKYFAGCKYTSHYGEYIWWRVIRWNPDCWAPWKTSCTLLWCRSHAEWHHICLLVHIFVVVLDRNRAKSKVHYSLKVAYFGCYPLTFSCFCFELYFYYSVWLDLKQVRLPKEIVSFLTV